MTAFVTTHAPMKENKIYDPYEPAKINSAVNSAQRINDRVATFLAILKRG